jgi:hypothetical protein
MEWPFDPKFVMAVYPFNFLLFNDYILISFSFNFTLYMELFLASTPLLKPITSWDESAARHILSRTIYGFDQVDVQLVLSKTLDEFVDKHLLSDFDLPAAPDVWVNETPLPKNTKVDKVRLKELIDW